MLDSISAPPTKTILVRPEGALAQGEVPSPAWAVIGVATLGVLIAVALLGWALRKRLHGLWQARKLRRRDRAG